MLYVMRWVIHILAYINSKTVQNLFKTDIFDSWVVH